jgi:hypothetical protein
MTKDTRRAIKQAATQGARSHARLMRGRGGGQLPVPH